MSKNTKEYDKKYYEDHKGQLLKNAKDYKIKNKEKILLIDGIPIFLAPWTRINSKSYSFLMKDTTELIKLWKLLHDTYEEYVKDGEIIKFYDEETLEKKL